MLLIKNIGILQTPTGTESARGEKQAENKKLHNAAILIEDGVIRQIVLSLQRDPGLVMSREQGLGFADVGPFGETFTPPAVILRDPVKLGQIETDQFCSFSVLNLCHVRCLLCI